MLTGIMAMAVSAATINSVEVTVDAPVPGECPYFGATVVYPEDDAVIQDYNDEIYINGVAWYDDDAEEYLTETDKFIEGHTYVCYVWVEPADPYDLPFDNNFDGYIIDSQNSGFDGNSSNEARIYGSFLCEKEKIHSAVVNLEDAPKYCELAYNTELYTMGLAEIDRTYNSDGFVKGVKWVDEESNVLKKGERFKANTSYYLLVRFIPCGGCEFDINAQAGVWVPGYEGAENGIVMDIDSDYMFAVFEMGNTGHPSKGLYTSSDGKKYYFDGNGNMYVKRLASISGKKYYFGADGIAYTKKLISVSGKKYYMGADGVAYTSKLISVNGKKYYMGKDGVAYTSKLISVNGKKYYMGKDGVAYTSKLASVDGKKYYFGKDGVAYKSKLISVSGKKYYIGKDCVAYKSKFASLSGKKYYFGSNCVMYKSKTFTVSGVKWKADANGVCKKV
jgi:hypothetical protein